MKLTCCLLFLLLTTVATASEPLGSLQITITGLKAAAGGELRIGLFHGEESWPKFKNARKLQIHPVTSEQLQIEFSALPYGDDYAIEIHHDENANGKFDMRWLPYPRPKEGVGVSNNRFGFGHPDFEDARFSVNRNETPLEIEMRY